MRRIWTIVPAVPGLCVALAASPGAHAVGVVSSAEAAIEATNVEAIVWMDGEQQTLVETIVVAPGPARFAILRAFPSEPSEISAADPALLEDLDAQTQVGEPYHHRVRRRLFGPSILTPILAPLITAAPPPVVTATTPVARVTLPMPAFTVFQGTPTTSTVTMQRILPSDLETWLTASDVELTRPQRELAGRVLDRGWRLAAAVVERPDPAQAVEVGPVLYRFATVRPLLPPFVSATGTGPSLRLYVLDRAVAPPSRPLIWNTQPWGPRPERAAGIDPFEVSYWGTFEGDVLGLDRVLGNEGATRGPRVLRADVRGNQPWSLETELLPAGSPRAIPGSRGRGSGFDLFLCALLGLAPLLYAPESWLLLWFATRARAGKKPGESLGLVGALWPLYALVVAVFWVITLPGTARIAALGPLVIGVWRLLFNEVERVRGPIRVDFARKLKPSDKKAIAARNNSIPPKPLPAAALRPGPAALPVKMPLAKVPAPPPPRIVPQAKLGITIPPPAAKGPSAPPPAVVAKATAGTGSSPKPKLDLSKAKDVATPARSVMPVRKASPSKPPKPKS